MKQMLNNCSRGCSKIFRRLLRYRRTCKVLLILLIAGLLFSGCNISMVEEKSLSEYPQLKRIPFNEPPFHLKRQEKDGKISLSINFKPEVNFKGKTEVEYSRFYDWLDLIAVPCSNESGKEYPIFIDTGYPCYVMTNGVTIIENDYVIYPFKKEGKELRSGLCHLPELTVGDYTEKNPFCQYIQTHWEVSFFGIPLWQRKGFLWGLMQMERFSYFKFDNPNNKLEFSIEDEFTPKDENQWVKYPLSIEDQSSGRRLMIHIPIAEKDIKIMFDSCGRYGMVVGPELWQELSKTSENISIRKGKIPTGFYGMVPCRKAKIPEFEVGQMSIKNAELILLDKDSIYLSGSGYLSMKFFEDKIVLLDFKRKLFWVEK